MLEKFSCLTVLISFYSNDIPEEIIDLNLFPTILKLIDKNMPPKIIANGILAINMLSHNSKLFDMILDKKLINMILKIAMDPNVEPILQQYSTAALVRFAINKKSLSILVENKIIDIFKIFRQDDTHLRKDDHKDSLGDNYSSHLKI